MRSRGQTQERGCDCGVGCDPGPHPQRDGSKGEDSVALGGEWGGMTQIVSTGTSGMGKKPSRMSAQGPPHPQKGRAV